MLRRRPEQPKVGDVVHWVSDGGDCHAAIVTGVVQTGDAPADADLLVLDARLTGEAVAHARPELAVPYWRHDARDPRPGSWHRCAECPR